MDEKLLLFWGFTENPTFRGGVQENQYRGELA